MRIVVVEDEANTREGIIKLIRKINVRYMVVGEADNGLDGIEIVRRTLPDLVIADIKMPKMTGIEMLEQLKECGIRHKTVILTGFSEFEYAQKALRMGVSEYLEKPITMEDLHSTLEKIEKELTVQKLLGYPSSDLIENAERLLARMAEQDGTVSETSVHILYEICGFDPDIPLYVLSFYLGRDFEQKEMQAKTEIGRLLAKFGSHIQFALPTDRSIAAIVQCQVEEHEFERMLRREVESGSFFWNAKHVLCWGTIQDLNGLKDMVARLKKCRKWSIVRGNFQILNEQILTETEIHHSTKAPSYPIALENKAKAALFKRNEEELRHCFREWMQECLANADHPEYVLKVSVRFLSSILQVAGEIHDESLYHERLKEYMDTLMMVQTHEEWIFTMEKIADWIIADIKRSSIAVPYSLTLQKAIRMIEEHFQEGITLEEIASVLRITPEYLSSLFTKEMKKTYSAYVKELRIKKAKELLSNSELKVFEIARRVGYPDAKYFSRVFKEETGLSPNEFQKLHLS